MPVNHNILPLKKPSYFLRIIKQVGAQYQVLLCSIEEDNAVDPFGEAG